MATYTDPSTINTNPNDPVTSEFGTAALDNPTAIAEGASGAPKVESEALNMFAGSGVGPFTGLDRVATVFSVGTLSVAGASTSGQFQYRLSSDGGATWGAWTAVGGLITVGAGDSDTQYGSEIGLIDVSASNALELRGAKFSGTGAVNLLSAVSLGVAGVSP